VHLDLCGNGIGPSGAESVARVLGQCAALAHLDLCESQIGPVRAGTLAGVLAQCSAQDHLYLSESQIEPEGSEFGRSACAVRIADLP
jgi:hypothetical protein